MKKKVEVIVCDLCTGDTPALSQVEVRKGERVVPLDLCRTHDAQVFKGRRSLVANKKTVLRVVNGKGFPCRKCGKRLPTKQGRAGHERIAHKRRRRAA